MNKKLFWRFRIQAIFILVALGLVVEISKGQTSNQFWQRQSIYQIITDRFYNGDTNNDNVEGTYSPANPTGVHGGDFKGIEQKLDYITSLGATAIWISPIVLNTEGQFHGYSGWNFYQVASHWGSISNLQHLVQAAHARGLLVIDDIVVNHAGDLVKSSGTTYNYPTGYNLSFVNNSKTYPAPFNLSATNPSLTNLFHNYGDIDNFNDSTQTVLGWLDGLNDFRTETPYVQTNMAAIYDYWIQQIGFDAFRIDTVLEVDMGFWQSFCPAIHAYAATNGNTNFFMFGETFIGNESTVASYTGTEGGGPFKFDSVLDYPQYFLVNGIFATASGNTAQIETHYNSVDTLYDPASRMQLVEFLDNHDNPRFLSTSESNNNTNRLEVALAFLYTARGIPSLYYGTEQGFDGTTDPNNREDMFAGEFKDGPSGTVSQLASPGADNFNMTHPLFQWIARLNNLRRLYPALTLGTHINQWNNPTSAGLFAYSRVLNTQEVFVVFNTAGSSQTLPARTLTYPTGTMLVNLLNTNETCTLTTGSQTPAIVVPGTTAKIFIAQSQMLPLDPVVMSNSPTHWTTNVPPFSPIVLQFSKPMDTNSVQAAFNTTPPINGVFTWSAAHDTMTFTASGGLPAPANIIVQVTNSAVDAVSGNAMFAPYTMQFSTALFQPFVMDGVPDSSGYLLSSNGLMTLSAALRGTTLYVSTGSPGTNGSNDYFIFVSDQLLPSASAASPWAKSGTVAVAATKPFLASESQNSYVSWFVNHSAVNWPAAKAPTTAGALEGTIDLVQAFGYMPTNIYLCAAAYATADGGSLVAQAPPGSGPNIETNEFFAIPTVTLADLDADGTFDRLEPALGFKLLSPQLAPGGYALNWASMPGHSYQIVYADSLGSPWLNLPGASNSAGPLQLIMTYTDMPPITVTPRFYRVKLLH